jgi:drug/metabolite transporter (DMT)-like permease
VSSTTESPAAGGASRSHVIVAFAAVYLIWGSTYLAIRFAVTTIPPFLMGAGRFLVSGVILYAWARQRGAPAPTRSQWRAAALTGVLLLVGGNGAVIWAEQHVASGMVALIVAVVPLWMVLLDWLRPGGTRPRPAVFVGLALGLVGLALLLGPDTIARHGAQRLDIRAALVPVLGSLFWALGSILSRYMPRPQSSQLSTGMQMLAGGAVFVVVSAIAAEPARFNAAAVTAQSLMGLVYLIIFGSLIGYTAYVYLLRAATPAKVATYAYVNPVVAVILGSAVADEPFTARMMVAAAVILGGVALITLANGKMSPRTSGDPAAAYKDLRRRRGGELLDRPTVAPAHEP